MSLFLEQMKETFDTKRDEFNVVFPDLKDLGVSSCTYREGVLTFSISGGTLSSIQLLDEVERDRPTGRIKILTSPSSEELDLKIQEMMEGPSQPPSLPEIEPDKFGHLTGKEREEAVGQNLLHEMREKVEAKRLDRLERAQVPFKPVLRSKPETFLDKATAEIRVAADRRYQNESDLARLQAQNSVLLHTKHLILRAESGLSTLVNKSRSIESDISESNDAFTASVGQIKDDAKAFNKAIFKQLETNPASLTSGFINEHFKGKPLEYRHQVMDEANSDAKYQNKLKTLIEPLKIKMNKTHEQEQSVLTHIRDALSSNSKSKYESKKKDYTAVKKELSKSENHIFDLESAIRTVHRTREAYQQQLDPTGSFLKGILERLRNEATKQERLAKQRQDAERIKTRSTLAETKTLERLAGTRTELKTPSSIPSTPTVSTRGRIFREGSPSSTVSIPGSVSSSTAKTFLPSIKGAAHSPAKEATPLKPTPPPKRPG